MSLRTLKFGDRTISYDAGLNSLPPLQIAKNTQDDLSDPGSPSSEVNLDLLKMTSSEMTSSAPSEVLEVKLDSRRQDDDGIGSSEDDETSSSSNSSIIEASEAPEAAEAGEPGNAARNPVEGEDKPFESDSSPNLARKKVIRPDLAAIDKLLAFDEEEEDDDDEEEEEDSDEEGDGRNFRAKKGWQKTVVKDMVRATNSSGSSSSTTSDDGDGSAPSRRKSSLHRRHSITICESKSATLAKRLKSKNSVSSNSSSTSAASTASGGSTPESGVSPRHSRSERPPEVDAGGRVVESKKTYALNVNEMHETLQDEFMSSQKQNEGMQTLNLRLDEVVHIRSVLTKAELEALPIDGNVRESVERGKVCFLCMKTKFGLFSRGQSCEMCKQLVCHRCYSKMKIPLEHFSNTPVYALSPCATPTAPAPTPIAAEGRDFHSLAPTLNHGPPTPRKHSFPAVKNSVGSAPNSPTMEKKGVTTISGHFEGVAGGPGAGLEPTTLSQDTGHAQRRAVMRNPAYATLPKKNRRMSWMGPAARDPEREKLEGSLLTVCTDCKDMVLQVIRTSRTTRRMQMVRSMFLSLTPDTVREQRL